MTSSFKQTFQSFPLYHAFVKRTIQSFLDDDSQGIFLSGEVRIQNFIEFRSQNETEKAKKTMFEDEAKRIYIVSAYLG